jgi:hypothetical protein
MIHPSRETLDQACQQQIRPVRGLMAGLDALHDADPDESLLQELAEAKKTLRELQLRRDAERAEAEKGQAGPRKPMGVPLAPETTAFARRHDDPAPAPPHWRLPPA